jgi:hypothetical protein
LIHVTVGKRHRVLDHRPLEMLRRWRQALIDPDDDFVGRISRSDAGTCDVTP